MKKNKPPFCKKMFGPGLKRCIAKYMVYVRSLYSAMLTKRFCQVLWRSIEIKQYLIKLFILAFNNMFAITYTLRFMYTFDWALYNVLRGYLKRVHKTKVNGTKCYIYSKVRSVLIQCFGNWQKQTFNVLLLVNDLSLFFSKYSKIKNAIKEFVKSICRKS